MKVRHPLREKCACLSRLNASIVSKPTSRLGLICATPGLLAQKQMHTACNEMSKLPGIRFGSAASTTLKRRGLKTVL